MNAAPYADYVADLRDLFAELDRHPERFQTFSAHLELAVAGGLVVYETTRRKGQTDSLYYGRPAGADANRQMPQASAFAAIDRFFALRQFVALTGAGEGALDARYPHCAVRFSYRRKGHPAAPTMLMVFIGFNDDADAAHYVADSDPALFVTDRPYRTERAHEWI